VCHDIAIAWQIKKGEELIDSLSSSPFLMGIEGDLHPEA
jgi:hypothetical protein